MLSLRVLGGPVPRGEKLLIDVTPSTSFEAMLPLIEQRLGGLGVVVDDMMGSLADQYDVVELQFVEGGKAKPCRTLSLHDSPKSAKLSAPAILLRLKQAATRHLTSSGSFQGGVSNSSFGGGNRSPVPAAISPTSSSQSVLLPPIQPASLQRRLSSSDTFGSDYLNTIPSSSLIAQSSPNVVRPGSTSVQQSLSAARTSREKLSILYKVPLGDLPRMLALDRVLRKAQATGRVEWLIAIAERALLGTADDMSGIAPPLPAVAGASPGQSAGGHRFILDDPSSEFAVSEGAETSVVGAATASSPDPGSRLKNLLSLGGGSPSHLLRKMRSSGLLPQRPDDKVKPRSTTLSISTMNVLLQRIHRDCTAALSLIFTPEHSLTSRLRSPPLPVDFKTFIFEAAMTPRGAVATLLNKLFELKFIRRDFEKFEQIERFRGEKAELLRFEVITSQIIQKMFYAQWCILQQGHFSVVEQQRRLYSPLSQEHTERQVLVASAFESFEYAIRKDYVEAAEHRHRWQYVSYHMQTREHFSRRNVVQQYWVAQRLLELERDFAMAAQVMMRIFRRALVGYRDIALLKLVDLETTYRGLLWRREWALRVVLFETQEQLYRHWLDETILTWLSPVVEKIAAKAIADGRVLLALEMREMRNVRAREEARLRVLLRQNSSVQF